MALNFTTSYTFSPNTTISSSQVNTNFTDIAGVFQGLEAETKTLAKLKMDIDPTAALNVATKQYVDYQNGYRRPVLSWGSATTVAVESGLDGTSGNIPILFPDGLIRTETSTTRTTFDITRNAVLTTSGAQSGLRATLSEATNTWYALYAVKVTDSSSQWVTVGDTRLPLQANFANLNTAFGTDGWVYLGLIRNGDNSGTTGDILRFAMSGHDTVFTNTAVSATSGGNAPGIRLATNAATQSLVYAYAAGTGTTEIPNNIKIGSFLLEIGNDAGAHTIYDSSGVITYGSYGQGTASPQYSLAASISVLQGIRYDTNSGVNRTMDIFFTAFKDNVLGIGSSPLL